jgi:hypothetical protein
MMVRHVGSAMLFGALVLTLAACNSGHLTRSRAKKQIEDAIKQSSGVPHALYIDVGTVSPICADMAELRDFDSVEHSEEDAILSTLGYLTTRQIRKHVWDVALTEQGQKAMSEKYRHKQKGADCDEWVALIPLAKYDHIDITGIVEDGVHAKADVSFAFVITPIGMDLKKGASAVLLDIDKKKLESEKKSMPSIISLLESQHEKYATDSLKGDLDRILGDDVVNTDSNKYVTNTSVEFEKYDNGWKIPPPPSDKK